MMIDRKFFERFEDKVKAAPEVRTRYERGDIKVLNGWRDMIPDYVKDYVSLNPLAA